MLALLIGFSLSLVSAQALVESSCSSNDLCWRNPEIAGTGYTTEQRVFAELLCYLDCLDTDEDNVRMDGVCITLVFHT